MLSGDVTNMSKGNRSDSRRETSHLRALNAQYAQEIDAYRRFAEQRRARRVHTQAQLGTYIERVNEYFTECEKKGKPFTLAGILLSIDIDRRTWDKMRNGEYDYLLEEYIARVQNGEVLPSEENDEIPLIAYSDFCEKCTLRVQEQRESACSSLRGNPAGNIFLLKAQMGLREDDAPTHVAQTLVICDSEQAKKAIDMLR